jgi:hypothetical protein
MLGWCEGVRMPAMRVPFRDLGATLLALGEDYCQDKLTHKAYNEAYEGFLNVCGWTMTEYLQEIDRTWDLTFTETPNPKG